MISLNESERKIVIDILRQNLPEETQVFVFGSRAKNNPKPYSDLDLFIQSSEQLQRSTLFTLQEAFEESILSFRVDLIDSKRCSNSFEQIIRPDCKRLL